MQLASRQTFWRRGKRLDILPGIYSDGVAYCVLTHVHQNPTKGKVEASVVGNSAATWQNLQGKNFFGDSTRDANHLLNNYNTNIPQWSYKSVDIQFYAGTGIFNARKVPFPITSPITIIGERNGNSVHLTLKYKNSGEVLVSKSATTSNQMTLGRLGIFTQNNAGAGSGVNPIGGRVPSNHAILDFKYWDGDDLIADLIPCADDGGECCFYNSVDGTFVRNIAGSGAFHPYKQ